MRNFIQEFKDFAIKGNMMDMAIGIIIGTAFNKVVSVLVKKVIMPPLSLMTEDVHLADKKYILREAVGDVTEVAIGYGELIEVIVDFAIISFTIFAVIKFMNRFRTKAEDPTNKEEKTPKNIELLANLEKLMKEQNEILRNNKE
ncbi:large conductance mechanosensitive channel protein MscL [Maribacter polysiphoniae]|uniref:Large-conductance mechanosensitive channel n=1 Tax=Maribacter polysiphoniae TaxID=429344 RepID=A0A316DXL1_9FLAO|nr:large conductance mechanosensitive channel protein MscL [Maribacter polysiphoniae]MBD1262500.1 large conductance mechanosensitive channel protein MscL [Maribacter polysiphoniae]PWK21333.1 large conductance mechanosensitive channel [Maribacter polysiphoniae]